MYSQRLVIKASEINLSGKEQIVKYVMDEYKRSEDKELEDILKSISLPTLSMSDVLDIVGEVMIRLGKGNLLQRGEKNSKKLRGFEEVRVLKGHPFRCKDKECDDCSGCELDENMPCSPGCEVLDPITGSVDKSYCIDNCDAVLNEYVVIEQDKEGTNDIYLGQVEAESYKMAVKIASQEYSLDESDMIVRQVYSDGM